MTDASGPAPLGPVGGQEWSGCEHGGGEEGDGVRCHGKTILWHVGGPATVQRGGMRCHLASSGFLSFWHLERSGGQRAGQSESAE